MPSYELIRRALAVRGPIRFGSGGDVNLIQGSGFPASGTAGDGAGHAGPGSLYQDRTRGTLWFNDGTRTSPYWQPVSYDQPEMWGVHTDFRDTVGVAIAGSSENVIIAGSGLRVFGDGTDQNDSGLVVQSIAEGGYVGRIIAGASDDELIAIGMEALCWQADQHGMGIVEARVRHLSNITNRSSAIGFIGLAADGLVAPVTGATTVATLVQNDLALLHFSTEYGDPNRYYAARNRVGDDNATMTAVDTSVDVTASGSWQLLRVEAEPVGTAVIFRCFLDKVLVATLDDALDEDQEHSPVLYLESNSSATKSMDVSRFAFMSGRA